MNLLDRLKGLAGAPVHAVQNVERPVVDYAKGILNIQPSFPKSAPINPQNDSNYFPMLSKQQPANFLNEQPLINSSLDKGPGFGGSYRDWSSASMGHPRTQAHPFGVRQSYGIQPFGGGAEDDYTPTQALQTGGYNPQTSLYGGLTQGSGQAFNRFKRIGY